MNPTASAIVILLIIMVGGLYLAFRLFIFMGRRGICTVVSIFRRHDAIGFDNAQTLRALGLDYQRPLFGSFWRDYKPWAFQTLAQAGVIRSTSDGLFYISEDKEDVIKSVGCKIENEPLFRR